MFPNWTGMGPMYLRSDTRHRRSEQRNRVPETTGGGCAGSTTRQLLESDQTIHVHTVGSVCCAQALEHNLGIATLASPALLHTTIPITKGHPALVHTCKAINPMRIKARAH